MRTGLVIVGSVVAILGGGLVITLFFLSGGTATTSGNSVQGVSLLPGSPYDSVISPSTSVAASITLSWSSTGPATVTLTPAFPCGDPVTYCIDGPPVFSWTNQTSGKATDSHANSSAYVLTASTFGTSGVRFSYGIIVAYQPSAPVPVWAWWLIAGGGVVLLAIGGIAIFLGLFLPSGVYSGETIVDTGRRPLDLPPDEYEDEPRPPAD